MKNQKELKAAYIAELPKVWGNDSKMIAYCTKKAAYVIEYRGHLFEIEKPRIETRFCFGAGMYATCTDEEQAEASAMAQKAQEDVNYFMDSNLREINVTLTNLREIREQMAWNWAEGSSPRWMVTVYWSHYYSQSDDCKLSGWAISDSYSLRKTDEMIWDVDFVDALIAGYEQVKADFVKRLGAYLKRYGLSKVESWTYIRD